MTQSFSDNILYYSPGSVFSNIAVLLLCELGIQDQFELKPLEMGVDNIAPWYIKLNPKGQVPTLIHLGKPVADTLNIANHIDKCFGLAPVLSTQDPQVLEVVEKWRQVRLLSLIAGKKTEGQDVSQLESTLQKNREKVLEYMQENPELKEHYKIRLAMHEDRKGILINHDSYLLQKARLESLLDETDRALQENDGELIPGKNRTVADIYVTGILYWLTNKLDKDILKSRPAIQSYYLHQSEKPSFIKAFVKE